MESSNNAINTLANGNLGAQLKRARISSGLTQQQVATQLGLSRETVSAIERNKESTIKALKAQTIVEWFNLCSKQMSESAKSSFIYSILRLFRM